MIRVLAVFLIVCVFDGVAAEPGEMMMHSTVRIIGENSSGSGLLVGRRPPGVSTNDSAYFTLITAAHVFDGISGEIVRVVQRVKTNGTWQRIEAPLRIREKTRKLWTQHPTADVAVIHVALPKKAYQELILSDLLLSDADFEAYVRPADEVILVGYPLGVEGRYGFPIARSGRIASYPLIPSNDIQTFFCDFNGFKGNSGGPVFILKNNPKINGNTHLGQTIFGVVGIFIQFRVHTEVMDTVTGPSARTVPLNLGVVVHSSLIRETIELTPPPWGKSSDAANSL